MVTFASKGWRREQWCVNVDQRKEEQEWMISIPNKGETCHVFLISFLTAFYNHTLGISAITPLGKF